MLVVTFDSLQKAIVGNRSERPFTLVCAVTLLREKPHPLLRPPSSCHPVLSLQPYTFFSVML